MFPFYQIKRKDSFKQLELQLELEIPEQEDESEEETSKPIIIEIF